MRLKRGIQFIDISLMMFGVMNLHRLGVDVWLEGVVREREWGECMHMVAL